VPKLALLVDFGSTFTKAVAVDLDGPIVVARSQHPSTVEVDVTIGLQQVIADIERQCQDEIGLRLASSSARGGLRLAAIGLVPTLTAEAARLAALGAGAKVIRTFSHHLTEADVRDLEELRPDLVLLTGGIDGGNRETIETNAEMLARSSSSAPVIVAGNRESRDVAAETLAAHGKVFYATENVLPELDRLNVEPARAVIREAFVRHIVEAKGLEKAHTMIDDIVMPTPTAVLEAAQLLAGGLPEEQGFGDLMVVDVGGATTDVHSVSTAEPGAGLIPRGLPEPVAKRTVEGDLGLRVSALGVVEAVGSSTLRADLRRELTTDFARRRAAALEVTPGQMSDGPAEVELDLALTAACVDLAVERHVGHVVTSYGARGPINLLHGKDLRSVGSVIGVGGAFQLPASTAALRASFARDDLPESMRPTAPRLYCDRAYLFYAAGLLAKQFPGAALRLLKSTLEFQE